MVQDEMEIDNSAMAEKQDVEKTLLEQLKEREALLCKAFEESTKNILSLSGPDGILNTQTSTTNFAAAQQNEIIQTQLAQVRQSLELAETDVKRQKKRKSDVLKEMESAQKMANAHFQAIDSEAKLKPGTNEVKMIDKFVSYCKGQIDQSIRKEVVLKLLTLCMKDDPRRDSFFSTLKENQDYEGNRGNLEWIRQQFLKSMRGIDWQGNQLAALVNIGMGFEKPQVYTSRLLDACRSTNISITTSATSSPVVKELILNWATKLPVTVQNQLQPHVKDLCDPVDQCGGGNIQDFIDLVIRHIKTEPERIVVPRYPCGWCSEDLVVSCSCQTAETQNAASKR
jgi:hypothetical protein